MFPTVDVPKLLAALVIDRANIAPGRTGIIEGFEEEVDDPDECFSPLPDEDPEESDGPDECVKIGDDLR